MVDDAGLANSVKDLITGNAAPTRVSFGPISPALKERITDQLRGVATNTVVLFDQNGNQEAQFPVTDEEARRHHNLSEYVEELDKRKEAKICSNGTPTPPPPQCLICSDGRVICSDAKFKTN